jgi:hypothetical protein
VSANLWCHPFAYEFDFKNLNLEITESFVNYFHWICDFSTIFTVLLQQINNTLSLKGFRWSLARYGFVQIKNR